MKNLRTDWVEFSIEGSGSDHIHIDEEINLKNLQYVNAVEDMKNSNYIYIYHNGRISSSNEEQPQMTNLINLTKLKNDEKGQI